MLSKLMLMCFNKSLVKKCLRSNCSGETSGFENLGKSKRLSQEVPLNQQFLGPSSKQGSQDSEVRERLPESDPTDLDSNSATW